jgi:hypothetical protein
MQRRDDEEYEPQDAPNDVTDERAYIDSLRASGNDPESQPDPGKSLRPNVRTYRPFLSVRVLKDTFEVKTTLQSRVELEGLKRLTIRYFQCSQFKGAQIEILTNPNPELLDELKGFRISYKEEHVIPFGIRLVYQGKAI